MECLSTQNLDPNYLDSNGSCHLPGVWPWASQLTFLYFSFPVCEMGEIIAPFF